LSYTRVARTRALVAPAGAAAVVGGCATWSFTDMAVRYARTRGCHDEGNVDRDVDREHALGELLVGGMGKSAVHQA